MKYYVIHQYYDEYNQFEGSWITAFNKFASLESAEEFIKELAHDEFIAGPLVDAKYYEN